MSVPESREFLTAETTLSDDFKALAAAQSRIRGKLQSYADGKVLKGNELVGWLGEIYGKLMFGGVLVADNDEHDFETKDGMRVSVKTRKGNQAGWSQCSAIPLIEGATCPTHLLFVHLTDEYFVRKMWLFPWAKLIEAERFQKHVVRGQFRSYFIRIDERRDQQFCIYARAPN